MVTRCAESFKPAYEKIHQIMVNLGLIHCDETGTRIDGKTWWGHNASNIDFTYLTIHRKRGRLDMNAADILPDFHGLVVHDCWGSYRKYQETLHAVCCAHLLRELNGVEENHPEQTWAARFKELLLIKFNLQTGKLQGISLPVYKESLCTI